MILGAQPTRHLAFQISNLDDERCITPVRLIQPRLTQSELLVTKPRSIHTRPSWKVPDPQFRRLLLT
jgi:hypothetical protein